MLASHKFVGGKHPVNIFIHFKLTWPISKCWGLQSACPQHMVSTICSDHPEKVQASLPMSHYKSKCFWHLCDFFFLQHFSCDEWAMAFPNKEPADCMRGCIFLLFYSQLRMFTFAHSPSSLRPAPSSTCIPLIHTSHEQM